ncbi:MAG: PAS domain-containing protein [Paracoccus denitrificans]|uniref:PAS domain-containing protein n=1 Tax=Paracoccus denitrificans TaxID=266 RepID=A0A533I7P4_PARDE|nr:MAG: PAS domain-containing protein [Paracoccus denitrificans]
MVPDLSILLALLGGAASVFIAMMAVRVSERRNRPALLAPDLLEPCIFLYQGERLVDATPPARRILAGCSGTSLSSFKSWLAHRFDDLELLDNLARTGGSVALTGHSGSGPSCMRLLAKEAVDGSVRLILERPDTEASAIIVDSLSQQAMEEEIAMLRGIVESAPMLMLRRDLQGNVVWANAAYLHAATVNSDTLSLPLPEILTNDGVKGDAGGVHRAYTQTGEAVHWFDCHDRSDAGGTTTFALPADAEVQAEQSLREFLQTLTKTFADLPIGLAIFDRERQLQLFNPALIDLTGLSAGFLTSRPSLYSVLDQLRELRMVPEPRDYRGWRKQITTLESAASAGHHVETWSLPGGRTYRVTGRPHPGGAVAFLFDDITSEITLTRKFRAELTLGSQVLDGLEQALIVFNAVGQVVMCNAPYQALWGSGPERLSEALQVWQGEWSEAPGLKELENALSREILAEGERGVLFGPDGKGVFSWTVTALPGGKRMACFKPVASQNLVPEADALPVQRLNQMAGNSAS